MASDSDFFKRLFEGPPRKKPSDDDDFNLEQFAEWLDVQEDSEESLEQISKLRRKEKFLKRMNKKKD